MVLIEGADYFIRYVKLPEGYYGLVTPNDDSTFSVYVDPRYPQEEQLKTLKHEIGHLLHDDFAVGVDPIAAEEEAEKRCG